MPPPRPGRGTAPYASVTAAVFASLVLVVSGDVPFPFHGSENHSPGVTSAFRRPAAHPALDMSDARVSHVPRGRGDRRKLDESGSATDRPVGANEQVHLIPGGANEMVVVWATRGYAEFDFFVDDDATVAYTEHGDAKSTTVSKKKTRTSTKHAPIAHTAYTAQTCLGESASIDPTMGHRPPVDVDALVAMANTSAWAPSDAANYFAATSPEDVVPKNWFTSPPWEKAICLRYNNPDAQYQSPLIHAARMSGLVGGRRYRYTLPGDTDADGPRTFTALLGAGDTHADNQPLVLGVVGDTGQTEVTHAVFEHLRGIGGYNSGAGVDGSQSQEQIHLLLHTGDLSYADGYAPRWDSFGVLAEPLMSSVPTLTTPGNHDVTLNGLESAAFRTRYPSPHASSKSPSPDWWSLDVGLAHVVGISSYAPAGGRGGEMGDMHDEDNETRADNVFGTFGLAGSLAFAMREWLVRDLASVDRSKTPWVIVMFHVPWYNSNQGHYKEAERHRWGLEKVLYDAGVDVILNGHVHSYERSSWVYDWRPDACGPTHLVVGDGGNYEGPYGGSWRTPQPDWSKFREGSFGAGRLTIYNETAARWRWHRTTCVEGTGTTELYNDTYFTPTGTHGQHCQSSNDISAQAMEAVDEVVFVRNVLVCPNKASGAGRAAPENKPHAEHDNACDEKCPYDSYSETRAIATITVLTIVCVCLLASLAYVSALLRRNRNGAGAYPHARLPLGDDIFDEQL